MRESDMDILFQAIAERFALVLRAMLTGSRFSSCAHYPNGSMPGRNSWQTFMGPNGFVGALI